MYRRSFLRGVTTHFHSKYNYSNNIHSSLQSLFESKRSHNNESNHDSQETMYADSGNDFTSPSSLYMISVVVSSTYVLQELMPILNNDNWIMLGITFFGSSMLWPVGVPLLYFGYTKDILNKFSKD